PDPRPTPHPAHEARALGHRVQHVNDTAVHQREVAAVHGEIDRADPREETVEHVVRGALEPRGPSRLPDRVHDVVAVEPARDELRHDLGRVLQIAVHHDDGVAGGRLEPGRDRCLMAERPRQVDRLDPGILGVQRAQELRRPIGAPVVDEDDVERQAAVERRREPADQLGNVVFLVEDGNDHRERARTAAGRHRGAMPGSGGSHLNVGSPYRGGFRGVKRPRGHVGRVGGDTIAGVNDVVLVTGGAGFIGSHLVERLLAGGARVRVLDNFSTGTRANLPFARAAGRRLEVIRGDIRNGAVVARAARGVRVIFHQAAMRSVPRSVKDPLGANENNVTGTLNVLAAARRGRVARVVYASSSSVYGDRPDLPKREEQPPAPISPYAVSKAAGEQYAVVWTRLYGVETTGLRYFNVFGPRQDPKSEYAAVVPRFILWGLRGKPLEVHGDGAQSRDFTYIDNVVEANLLAARTAGVGGEVFNVGCGDRVSLLAMIAKLEAILGRRLSCKHVPPRPGDVPHTLADVSKGKRLLGYSPLVPFDEGLRRTVEYF